jgi:hypothetical protein
LHNCVGEDTEEKGRVGEKRRKWNIIGGRGIRGEGEEKEEQERGRKMQKKKGRRVK